MNVREKNESGSVAVIATVVALVVLFIGAAVFAVWAYMGRQDYKSNVDQKVRLAVQANTKQVQAADAASFAEEAKKPLKAYNGPEAYGSVSIQYPKTWSAYLSTNNATIPVNFYAHPDIVPGVDTNGGGGYALRVQVVAQPYSTVLKSFDGLLKQSKVTVTAYALPKNPSNIGARVEGQIDQSVQGKMVILPLRDKTLKIWTESNAFYNDFEQTILPNASFVP